MPAKRGAANPATELLEIRRTLDARSKLVGYGEPASFEQVQNDMNFYWTKQEVLEKLDTKMTNAFNAVLDMSEKEGVYMRDAAYMVAIKRVVKAMELRGWLNASW